MDGLRGRYWIVILGVRWGWVRFPRRRAPPLRHGWSLNPEAVTYLLIADFLVVRNHKRSLLNGALSTSHPFQRSGRQSIPSGHVISSRKYHERRSSTMKTLLSVTMGGGTGVDGGGGDRSPASFSTFNIMPIGVAWKESTSNDTRPPNRRAVAPPLSVTFTWSAKKRMNLYLWSAADTDTVQCTQLPYTTITCDLRCPIRST